jgi:hypothetical protein
VKDKNLIAGNCCQFNLLLIFTYGNYVDYHIGIVLFINVQCVDAYVRRPLRRQIPAHLWFRTRTWYVHRLLL